MLSPHRHLGVFAGEQLSRCRGHDARESVFKMLAALACTGAFILSAAIILGALA